MDGRVKRVSFSSEATLIYIVENTNRHGVWEHYALDRIRFQRRVQAFEDLFKRTVLVHIHHNQAAAVNHE